MLARTYFAPSAHLVASYTDRHFHQVALYCAIQRGVRWIDAGRWQKRRHLNWNQYVTAYTTQHLATYTCLSRRCTPLQHKRVGSRKRQRHRNRHARYTVLRRTRSAARNDSPLCWPLANSASMRAPLHLLLSACNISLLSLYLLPSHRGATSLADGVGNSVDPPAFCPKNLRNITRGILRVHVLHAHAPLPLTADS